MNKDLNKVRIIGGKWRHRNIVITPGVDIRPTPNRVRETLFNWLMPVIDGAVCLDLFAGSGALGFEALSRGAKKVVMVDKSPKVIETLQNNAELLGAEDIDFICANFSANWGQKLTDKFDIVFLDPPFGKNLIATSWRWLEEKDCFAKNAYLYLEAESSLQIEAVSERWQEHRQKKAGDVVYSLWTCDNTFLSTQK